MKKVMFVLLLFLLPFMINAETCDTSKVSIESISTNSIEGSASEVATSIVNNTVMIDLNMNKLGDSLTYKLLLKNDSNDDFELGNNSVPKSDYIKYTIQYDDESSVLKAHSTKTIFLNVEYDNEVEDNTYNENENYSITLSTLSNPKTGVIKYGIIIIVIILICSVVSIIFVKKSNASLMMPVLIGLLLIPLGINAICQTSININSSVEIKKIAEFDQGIVVNNKMYYLANSRGMIFEIKRAKDLPEDIKTLVDNQLLQKEDEIIVTDEEVEERFHEILSAPYAVLNDFTVKENNDYCYTTISNTIYCYSKERYKAIMLYNDLDCNKVKENSSDEQEYLTYVDELDDLFILSENEYKEEIRKDIIREKKNQLTKNILSSDDSNYLIYGWYSDHVIYYYSDSEEIHLNKDSSYMFYNFKNLYNIPNINYLNTSNVANASGMFMATGSYLDDNSFKIDISNWDTRNVTNMSFMFYVSYPSTNNWSIGDISNWNTSKVEDFQYMFHEVGKKNTEWSIGDLSNWDVSNAKNMAHMFENSGMSAKKWNIGNLSNWNTSKVKDMSYMFHNAGRSAVKWRIGDLSSWDLSSAENIDYMFSAAGCDSEMFSLNVSGWDISHLTSLKAVFSATCENAEECTIGDLSNWNTSNIKDMSFLFSGLAKNTSNWNVGDLSNWDTSNVVNMEFLFNSVGYKVENLYLNIGNWNTSKVTNMNAMFARTGYDSSTINIDLSLWDVANVEDMSVMFSSFGYNANSINIGNLSSWDTSKVVDMTGMFDRAGKYATIWNDIGTLKVYQTDITRMFYWCRNIIIALSLYEEPVAYLNTFTYSTDGPQANIVVNYSSNVNDIDTILRSKSNTSKVTKGVTLD